MKYELYHWGVKGMKWGVRRYQNVDGTLTRAGKKRYDKAVDTMDKIVEKRYKNAPGADKEQYREKLNKMTMKDVKVDRARKSLGTMSIFAVEATIFAATGKRGIANLISAAGIGAGVVSYIANNQTKKYVKAKNFVDSCMTN